MATIDPHVYIIILNWNGWADTIACLSSISELEYEGDITTIVIDNGSTDNSWEKLLCFLSDFGGDIEGECAEINSKKLEKLFKKYGLDSFLCFSFKKTPRKSVILIRLSDNIGFTGGCNLGVDYALQSEADYVFLLNNDAKVDSKAIRCLVDVSVQECAAILGAVVVDESGYNILFCKRSWIGCFFGIRGKQDKKKINTTHWVSSGGVNGSAMLLRKDFLVKRVNDFGFVFDPDFFMYFEETDLCLYGRSIGYPSIVANNAVVFHSLSKSSGGPGNPRTYYYLTRNRIYLANRWLPFPLKAIFHVYHFVSRATICFFKVAKGRVDTAVAIFSGLIDGYSGVKGKWRNHGD